MSAETEVLTEAQEKNGDFEHNSGQEQFLPIMLRKEASVLELISRFPYFMLYTTLLSEIDFCDDRS